MSVQELPVRSDFKAYTFQIDLDGQTYTLTFRFNTRINLWVMDIADAVGTIIRGGAGLVIQTNVPLTDQYQSNSSLPPGRFIAIDETGQNRDAGTDDLGNDIKLVYEEAG